MDACDEQEEDHTSNLIHHLNEEGKTDSVLCSENELFGFQKLSFPLHSDTSSITNDYKTTLSKKTDIIHQFDYLLKGRVFNENKDFAKCSFYNKLLQSS